MTDKEEMRLLEHRLTVMEMDIAQLRFNSDERLAAIMARFDKQDRRSMWWVNAAFAAALAFGGIYLESYLNKEDVVAKPVAVVTAD